jgi:hypothetical protein
MDVLMEVFAMKGTLIMEAAIATVVFSVVASTYGLVNPAAPTTISTTVNQAPTILSVRLPSQP